MIEQNETNTVNKINCDSKSMNISYFKSFRSRQGAYRFHDIYIYLCISMYIYICLCDDMKILEKLCNSVTFADCH